MTQRLARVMVLSSVVLGGCLGDGASQSTVDAGSVQQSAQGDMALSAADNTALAARTVNYGLALRTAALKLTGDLPTLDEQDALARATNAQTTYAAQIDKYLADPRFAEQLIAYHRDTFRLGGSDASETAPTFAARVVFEGRPYDEIFTATDNTCPTWDGKAGAFVDGVCKNNSPVTAGVLTNPGVQAQFVSNMAFRRTRWVQETFDCRKFPAEFSHAPMAMGSGQYTSPWPFDSITGGKTAPVDFQDTSAVICANCHTSMNHIAPLFANYDAMGMWHSDVQVTTPTAGLPKTARTDWLPAGETTAWRFGQEVSDLGALGKALAADADVQGCIVERAYNFAMSKGDVVIDLQTVPSPVLAPLEKVYADSKHDLKATLRAAFTSDDFVKF